MLFNICNILSFCNENNVFDRFFPLLRVSPLPFSYLVGRGSGLFGKEYGASCLTPKTIPMLQYSNFSLYFENKMYTSTGRQQ